MSSTSASDFEIQEDYVQYLSARFFNNEFCTWADLVLISINPLRELPFTKDRNIALKKALKGESSIRELEPHIYSVVHRALCCLSVNRIDQIIVFSGDSGSGKSHAAEDALNFIADVSTPLSQICHAQTLLSCFGNAATEYHGNSSRFGNLLVLNYSEFSKTILKAKIRTYLLEKTRVSSPSVRNFHVFYQLIAACKLTGHDDLYLNTDKKFRILPGQITADDGNGFKKMLEAFAGLDFDWPLIKSIFEVIAGILHLGNIVFTSTEDSSFNAEVNWEESCDDLQKACELLGLESETLALILTNSLISFDKNEGRTIQIPFTSTRDATTRRDSLMKLLYSLLFNWIVSYINKKFDLEDSMTTFKLGLLDIYGFEMFSRNSLEQLCINYANERLHNFFVQDILIQKKKMLEDEGLLMESELVYMEEDYSRMSIARINLLDAQSSVFSVINEGSLLLHHCEGKEVCHKLENLSRNNLIQVDRYNEKFVIKHFSGNVTYNSNHMVEKNSDKVPNELIKILQDSSKDFVTQLVAEDKSHSVKHTVLGKFKRSLDVLMNDLKMAQVHYVRCIKPNIQMKPGLVDKHFFEKQLQSSGIMEAIKLCGHCLPVRLNLDRFFSHFGCLIKGRKYINADLDKLICFEKWANGLGLNYQMGEGENIFLEESILIDLENKIQFLRKHSSKVIQFAWRRYRHNAYNSVLLPSASIVQRYSSLRQINLGESLDKSNYMRLVLNSFSGIQNFDCLDDIDYMEVIDALSLANRSQEIRTVLSSDKSDNENRETSARFIENKLHLTCSLPALPSPQFTGEPIFQNTEEQKYQSKEEFECQNTDEPTFPNTEGQKYQSTGEHECQNIDKQKYENTEEQKYQITEEHECQNTDKRKYENTEEPTFPNTEEQKYQITEEHECQNTDKQKYENTEEPTFPNTEEQKYQSTKEVECLNIDEPKYQSTEELEYQNTYEPTYEETEEPTYRSTSHKKEINSFSLSSSRESLVQLSLISSISRRISFESTEFSSKISDRLQKLKNSNTKELTENKYKYNYNLLKKIEISTKKVGSEVFFVSNTGIASRRALAKVPIWFHTKTTCIPYSHIVPAVLLPIGIEDALE